MAIFGISLIAQIILLLLAPFSSPLGIDLFAIHAADYSPWDSSDDPGLAARANTAPITAASAAERTAPFETDSLLRPVTRPRRENMLLLPLTMYHDPDSTRINVAQVQPSATPTATSSARASATPSPTATQQAVASATTIASSTPPAATATPQPAQATATSTPTDAPLPPTSTSTDEPLPTSTPVPSKTPEPDKTTVPTSTPKPATSTPVPTSTPQPTSTSTSTPRPTRTPVPTSTPKPATSTPEPTSTPKPATSTPRPTRTPVPTSTPTHTNTPVPTSTPTDAPLPPTSTPTDAPLPPTSTPTDAPAPLPLVAFEQASYTVNEDGGSATITVLLSAASAQTVSVSYATSDDSATSGSDYTPASGTLTFAPGTTQQSFSVPILDDALEEPQERVMLTLDGLNGAEPGNPISAELRIADNDSAGISIAPANITVSEDGQTASYTVVLNSQPAAAVTIDFSANGQLEAIAPLTFTPANWNTPQSVTVRAVDDAVMEGEHSATISHSVSSSDSSYASLAASSVSARIADNDSAAIIISQSGGSTSVGEGGPNDSYTIVLSSQPSANVQVIIATGPQLASVAALTFTPANWNTPQTVTIKARNDNIAEGTHNDTLTHTISSSDSNYDNLTTADISVTITDNDSAGVTFSSDTLSVGEGGPNDSYTIVLDSEPTADVTINITTDAQVQPIAALTFTPTNWNTPQSVTVHAVDDNIAEGAHSSSITYSVSSSDSRYNGSSIDSIAVDISDNDAAGVSVSPLSSATTSEAGDSAQFSIVLDSQPTAAVSIDLSSSDTSEGTLNTASLTFTSGNWDTPQFVTVTGQDDAVMDGDISYDILIDAASSSDPNYAGIDPADLTLQNTDDDAAGVILSSTSLSVGEGGPNDSYTIVLDSEPTADVTINITTDAQVQPIAALTFTPTNWNTPQTITVQADDDSEAEGPHSSSIGHSVSSSDPNYDSLVGIPDVTVDIADNDSADVSITPGSLSLTEGDSGTYFIELTSDPIGPVTVTITPDSQLDLGSGAGVPITLSFDSTNWNTPQTITVQAVDDALIEGPHTGTIVHSVSSGDPNYDSLVGIPDVTVTIADNDLAYDLAALNTSVLEDAAPPITLTIDRSGATDLASTVDLSLTGTATDGSDYSISVDSSVGGGVTLSGSTVDFAAGASQVTLRIDVQSDTVNEGNETIAVTLSNPTASGSASIASNGPVNITIYEDDVANRGRIGNRIWEDADGDGRQDAGESNLPGVTVNLYISGDLTSPFATLTTSAAATNYEFIVPPGNYRVEVVVPPGYTVSPRNALMTHWLLDSDADPDGFIPDVIVINSGETRHNWDIGLVP